MSDYFSKVIAGAGQALGLPEMGISERFGMNGEASRGQVAPDQGLGILSQLGYTPTRSTGSTDVLGASTQAPAPTAPAPDPYAQWGGEANYNAKRSGFSTQQGGIRSSAGAAAGAQGGQYKSGILDYLDQLRQGQNTIDSEAEQAELAKIQGAQGVRDFVGQGIQSGGVMLANKNASSSSAGDEIARAYSQLGGRQMNQIGNEYAQDQHEIDLKQQQLDAGTVTAGRHNEENKVNVVNSIVADATKSLNALQAEMAGAALPDRIDMEREAQAIKQNAMSQLQQYDQLFSQGVGGIKASTADTRRANAAALSQRGVAAANPYELTTEAPAEFQGTGGFNSNLPVFTLPRKREA